jgi:hypothetical protein
MADSPEPSKPKRFLPVVGQRPLDSVSTGDASGDSGGGDERSPLAWSMLGAMASFVLLLPLSLVAMPLLRWAPLQKPLPLALIGASAVALAAFAGGYFVGRVGQRVSARHGAVTGAFVGVILWALARLPTGFVLPLLTIALATAGTSLALRSRGASARR